MQATQYPGLAFSIYSRSVVVVALMLIWLGAATTTKQAGMIFADWPLSMGTFNPPGWLDNLIPFLEHSHRLFAKLVGFLVLGLFCWSYVRSWRKAGEVFGLVFWMALTLAVFIAAGAERFDAERKQMLFWIGLVCASLPMSWLIWSWRLRGWNSIQKWSALALLMVTTQAILGGLRVTEISDGFAVFHGCFAQLFFCVLIFVTMLSSRRWPTLPFSIPGSQIKVVRWGGVVLISLVAIQLLLGAIMRHYHRAGLVDTDLVRTQGEWIPSFEEPLIAVMFLHKFTAMSLLLFTVGLWLLIRGIRSESKSSPSGQPCHLLKKNIPVCDIRSSGSGGPLE
ncbi:MAG: COX15/CtaA family protein, partial [Verrucomicrobiota bacterium]